jgi:hypothetical protein
MTNGFEQPDAHYYRTRDRLTQQVLAEVDAYVTENVVPRTIRVPQVKAALDEVLNHVPKASLEATSAFLVTLTSGNYLIISVDVMRTGQGPDDAMWLRAYKETGQQFVLVSDAEYTQDRKVPANEGFLMGLQILGLPPQPSAQDVWFVAWARRHLPDSIALALRLCRFNGETFSTGAITGDIVPSFHPPVRPTPDGGFTVHRRTAPEGPHIVEQYAVTAQGPVKVNEWKADRR